MPLQGRAFWHRDSLPVCHFRLTVNGVRIGKGYVVLVHCEHGTERQAAVGHGRRNRLVPSREGMPLQGRAFWHRDSLSVCHFRLTVNGVRIGEGHGVDIGLEGCDNRGRFVDAFYNQRSFCHLFLGIGSVKGQTVKVVTFVRHKVYADSRELSHFEDFRPVLDGDGVKYHRSVFRRQRQRREVLGVTSDEDNCTVGHGLRNLLVPSAEGVAGFLRWGRSRDAVSVVQCHHLLPFFGGNREGDGVLVHRVAARNDNRAVGHCCRNLLVPSAEGVARFLGWGRSCDAVPIVQCQHLLPFFRGNRKHDLV